MELLPRLQRQLQKDQNTFVKVFGSETPSKSIQVKYIAEYLMEDYNTLFEKTVPYSYENNTAMQAVNSYETRLFFWQRILELSEEHPIFNAAWEFISQYGETGNDAEFEKLYEKLIS